MDLPVVQCACPYIMKLKCKGSENVIAIVAKPVDMGLMGLELLACIVV